MIKSSRKGMSPLISYVLLVGMIVSATAIILSIGLPIIEDMRDTATIEEAINNLGELDAAIRETASGGTHTSRNFHLISREGEFTVDEEDNSVIFEIETDSGIISRHTSQDMGPITLASDAFVELYRTEEYGEDCYMMENEVLKACIKDVGSPNSYESIDNSELIVRYENKELDDELNPDVEVVLDDDEESKSGEGYTYPIQTGHNLATGQVSAHIDSENYEYNIYFKLYSDSDFLKIEVES